MINTTGEIKDEVLVRLNASTTVAFYTDTILDGWINDAHRWAASYKKWAFTEKADTSTTFTGTEQVTYPSNIKSDSVRIMTIGGKRFQKLNFEDYLLFKEDTPGSSDRVFSDFARTLYINPNVSESGTITLYGQYLVDELDKTEPNTKTVFSDSEIDGNEAMIHAILSYATTRQGKAAEAEGHFASAVRLLDGVWQRQQDEQFAYHSKNRGMWERIDVVEGDYHNELFKRDQF